VWAIGFAKAVEPDGDRLLVTLASGERVPLRIDGDAMTGVVDYGTRDPAAASARRGQRPPLGGETTVARRTLCTERLGRHGQRDGPGSRLLRPQKGGAIRRPCATIRRGQPLARPGYPSLSGLPPMVQPAATTRVRSNRPRTSRRGALPPMKRVQGVQGMGTARRTKVACDAKRAKPWPSPGDAPSWEESARPDAASALRVGCGTRPAGMVLKRVRTVQG
jgi:hypothetical protein